MKRIIQLLASIFFIMTVLTVYLTFDFAINNAVSNEYLSDKHNHHEHDIESVKPTSSDLLLLSLSSIEKVNRLIKHNGNDTEHNHHIYQERRARTVKSKQAHNKLAQFHKSKTGVKINHIKKSLKEQRKHLSTTTTKYIQEKDKKNKNNKKQL